MWDVMRRKLSTETQSQGAGSRVKHNNSWTITSSQLLVLIQLREGTRTDIILTERSKGDENEDKQRTNTIVTTESRRQGREGHVLEDTDILKGYTRHKRKRTGSRL